MNRKALFCSILLAGAFIALACSGLRFSLPERNLQVTPNAITAVATASVPLQTPADYPRDCYYNWAYKSLTELSEQVQAVVRELYPDAKAHAQAYGEDCIYADGHADFIAMETDFFVTLEVASLNDDAEAGTMIRRTADLILSRFPTGVTPGPRPGRFSYRFTSAGKERIMSFETAAFQMLPPGLTGADLMQALIR
jgi:hypothetical protein